MLIEIPDALATELRLAHQARVAFAGQRPIPTRPTDPCYKTWSKIDHRFDLARETVSRLTWQTLIEAPLVSAPQLKFVKRCNGVKTILTSAEFREAIANITLASDASGRSIEVGQRNLAAFQDFLDGVIGWSDCRYALRGGDQRVGNLWYEVSYDIYA